MDAVHDQCGDGGGGWTRFARGEVFDRSMTKADDESSESRDGRAVEAGDKIVWRHVKACERLQSRYLSIKISLTTYI